MLELVAILFIFIDIWKKMLLMLSLVPVLKWRFNKLKQKSQTNGERKSNLLFSQQHNQSQKCPLKPVKNRQKALERDLYLLHWIHNN